MSMSTYVLLFILVCLPVFTFFYNLIAAIGHNVRKATQSDEPYQVAAIGNILAASVSLTLILCAVFLLFACY